MGKPTSYRGIYTVDTYKGKPGELKHLSNRRKRHQRDSVSSGERTRTRPLVSFIGLEFSGKESHSR